MALSTHMVWCTLRCYVSFSPLLTCTPSLAGGPVQSYIAHLNCQHRPVLMVSCCACRSCTARVAWACSLLSTAAQGACRRVHDLLHKDTLLCGCTDSGAQASAGVACVSANKHDQQSESSNQNRLGRQDSTSAVQHQWLRMCATCTHPQTHFAGAASAKQQGSSSAWTPPHLDPKPQT